MYALSIKQPWAWLIANGFKDIENRTWPTNYRGPVLIHAGKSVDRGAYDWIASTIPDAAAARIPVISTLPKGGIVGYAEIIDCVANSQSKWFAGPWGFVIKNGRPLPFISIKGQLKFFQIPYKLNKSGVLMADEMEITKREDTLSLPVALGKDELISVMDDISQKIKAFEDLEEELSDIKKDYGKSMKKLDAEIRTLAKNYREKTKVEEIECIIEFNWTKGIKHIIRKSSGEVLQEKPITDEDRQEKLDLEDHGKPLDGSIPEESGESEDATDGKVLEIVDNEPGTDVEVKNGEKWVEIPFAGLKEGQTFRMVKEGEIQNYEGKETFKAIGDPEQEDGFWKIAVV